MEQLVAQEDPRRIQPARDEDWEPFKEAITQLYWTEEGRLREVMNIMQAVHNFCATEKQYRTRFKKWNLEKNINSKRMKAMVGIQKRRQENGKGTEFSFHGRPVPQEKIDRWQKRQKSAEELRRPLALNMGHLRLSPSLTFPLIWCKVHPVPTAYGTSCRLLV
ncbi:Clr5 domain-containing protein [Lasiosphaeria hispida]|uniref:Clr5 domain-containing protein n=1 Tax=Lasiosphaeria hispida TaxID=260671 RepID=A0AAJ0M7I6_9PEZI|nr:Clr5 domain-containing protein [Lasiosphaeria hispida]